jgi:AsmA protein
MENLEGQAALGLANMQMRQPGAPLISRAQLNLTVPGPSKPSHLTASVIYRNEPVAVDASLAPLIKLLSGARAPAKLAVRSRLFTVDYDGTVQSQPIPAAAGTFDVDIPSVGRLASWIGRPLGHGQPDPGPLKLHAVIAGAGPKLALKTLTIVGKAIQATANGHFDRSKKTARFDADINVQEADLNAYLPPAQKSATKPAPTHATAAKPAAGWSTQPFDVSALGSADGQVAIHLNRVRYRDLDVTSGAIRIALANRVLKFVADKLQVAEGTVSSAVTLDASGAVPKLNYQASATGVQARPLLQTFAGSGRLSGTVVFDSQGQASGQNEKAMIGSLNGNGRFKITNGAIYGINLAATLRRAGTLGFGSSQTEKTDFAELSGSYTIKSGTIDNRDLKMLAPLVRLSGAGTVPMPPQTVDYEIDAKLVPTLAGQGGQNALAGLPIPIKITGSWQSPNYKVDWRSVFQTMAKDPARLKNLPANLAQTAKGFGVKLPNLGGFGNILKNLPTAPTSPAPSSSGTTSGSQTAPSSPIPNLGKLFGQ